MKALLITVLILNIINFIFFVLFFIGVANESRKQKRETDMLMAEWKKREGGGDGS